MTERAPGNAPGSWYVDTRCIDCSAARTVAPGLIVRRGGQSVFARQPGTPEELMIAWRARLLCPTASVHSEARLATPDAVFPEPMTDTVWRLGYNARESYGAHSFAIRRPNGNVMVDALRWTQGVVTTFEGWGGLAHILLTHRDDVADAERYAVHFGARVWIHEDDRGAAPYATDILRGREPTRIAGDLLAIPVPGHTKGSVVYLYDERCLFTGDSLAWSFERDDLTAFRDVAWWSWPEQLKSLRRLLDHDFEWVLAGHGGSRGRPPTEMRTRLAAMLKRMEEAPRRGA
jgi:glyoxylase-like metal-dependent hydrolase (beta-lactamase superfamily II)